MAPAGAARPFWPQPRTLASRQAAQTGAGREFRREMVPVAGVGEGGDQPDRVGDGAQYTVEPVIIEYNLPGESRVVPFCSFCSVGGGDPDFALNTRLRL